MGETDGLVKIVADGNDRIIGAHILGPHASDLIMELTLAMKMKAKVQDVMDTIHIHPTLAEAVGEAAEDVFGLGIHFVR
jgi:dihydrolipoamide dehydrogenase